MRRETLQVKKIRYYISCTNCGNRTFFDEYSKTNYCSKCNTKNNVFPAIVVEDDNYEDLTAYHDLKIVGFEIKTRRN